VSTKTKKLTKQALIKRQTSPKKGLASKTSGQHATKICENSAKEKLTKRSKQRTGPKELRYQIATGIY